MFRRKGIAYILSLVVLQDAAQCSLSGTESSIQRVNVCLLRVGFLSTVTNLQFSGLVVCAVGAGNELLVFALEGEPGFEVVFLRGCVVQGTGHDRDYLVREPK